MDSSQDNYRGMGGVEKILTGGVITIIAGTLAVVYNGIKNPQPNAPRQPVLQEGFVNPDLFEGLRTREQGIENPRLQCLIKYDGREYLFKFNPQQGPYSVPLPPQGNP
jgi:hypothetical protein